MKNNICFFFFQREEENSSHRLLASNSIDWLCHSIHSKLGSNRLQDVYIEIYKPTFPQNFYISYFVSSAKRFISNQSMLINSYIQREINNSLNQFKSSDCNWLVTEHFVISERRDLNRKHLGYIRHCNLDHSNKDKNTIYIFFSF